VLSNRVMSGLVFTAGCGWNLGAQLSLDDGFLVMREPDDALGLSGLASSALCDNHKGKNTATGSTGCFGIWSMGGWRITRMSTMLTVLSSTWSCDRL